MCVNISRWVWEVWKSMKWRERIEAHRGVQTPKRLIVLRGFCSLGDCDRCKGVTVFNVQIHVCRCEICGKYEEICRNM